MEITQITKFRREVLRRIAKYTWNDCLPDKVYDILYNLVREDTPRVRCCVHKERAVLKNRIQMALWQPAGLNIIDAANAALKGEVNPYLPVIDVLPAACDACPIERYCITDVCRHCIQHKCIDQCPKKAISIQGNKIVIDREECIECGRCVQVCPFGAIVEVIRPCIRACEAGAILVGRDKQAIIDPRKCVSCGHCRSACPFGAIDERSFIVQVLLTLRKKEKLAAMLAPSFVAQFGPKVSPEQVVAGLKKIGFTEVVLVAEGADMVALHETEEFLQKVPEKLPFMTSSCCPAFVSFVKKHYPQFEGNISETVSPMVACGRWLKSLDKDLKTCFIGPCIAKKGEALDNRDSVDYVLTFEEIQCVFEGIGIDLSALKGEEFEYTASVAGSSFPLERGVQKAIESVAPDKRMAMAYANGIADCDGMLKNIEKGELHAEYCEGMACQNGCIDGPGALSVPGFTRVMVKKFLADNQAKSSRDNESAVAAVKNVDLTVKETSY